MAVAPPSSPLAGERRQSFAKGGMVNLVGAGTNAVLTFLLVVVLTSRVGQEQVGAFMVGVAALTILSQTVQLGANTGLVRFVALMRVRGDGHLVRPLVPKVFLPVAVAGIAGAIILTIAASSMAELLGGDADAELAVRYLRLIAPLVPFAGLFLVASQFSQAFGTMTPAVTVDKIGRSLVQVVGLAIFAPVGAVAVVAAYGIAYPVGLVVLAIWIARLLTRFERGLAPPSDAHADPPVREFWTFSAPRGLSTMFQVTVLWADTILIGFLRSIDEAAVYSVATRYLLIGHLVIGALLQAMSPRLAEFLAQGSIKRAQGLYQRTASWIVAAVWPTYLGIAIFAPWLLRLFGDDYVAGASALRIVAVAMLVAAACGAVDNVLLMAGKSWLSVANWGAALVVNISLNLLLIPVWGIDGAAVAWAASILVRNVIPVFEVWYMFGVHPVSAMYARVIVASLVVVGGSSMAGVAIFGMGFKAVAAGAVPGALVYLALVYRWWKVIDLPSIDAPHPDEVAASG